MEQKENKVGIKGWIALFVLCVMFSGVLKNAEGPLAAFDFSNLVGAWARSAMPVRTSSVRAVPAQERA